MKPRTVRKGAKVERELARKLWEAGLAVMRAPASGSGTRRLFYPDLVAMYKGRIAVIEVKYRTHTEGYIRIEKEKLEKLLIYAVRAGGEAFLALKVPTIGWRIAKLEPGKQSLKVRDIVDTGFDLDSFIRYMKGRNLMEYMSAQTGKLSSRVGAQSGSKSS